MFSKTYLLYQENNVQLYQLLLLDVYSVQVIRLTVARGLSQVVQLHEFSDAAVLACGI